ncbi:MAG: hypothetical protein ACRDYY_09375 [Acidimicrobiales bacterium]
MRRFSSYFVVTSLCLLVAAAASAAKQPSAPGGYTLVGNAPGTATLVPGPNGSGTAVQLMTYPSSGTLDWGAIGFAASGLKLRDVTDLSTDYEITFGGCWEGSPRFTVGLSNRGKTKEIWFYMGQPQGCASEWTNTGNLASPTSLVDDSSLPAGSHTATYSQVQAEYGNDNVAYIAIDLDGGGDGSQTALFDNTQVNGTLYTYES